jgi:hypothetical protein
MMAIFLCLPMNDCHGSYKQKFLKRKQPKAPSQRKFVKGVVCVTQRLFFFPNVGCGIGGKIIE